MWVIAVALALILSAAVLKAGDRTYNVNESVGPGFVTGTITTDGSIGTLATGDIVNWNLNINDGTDPTFDLEGPLSGNNSGVLVSGSDLTSTATQLLFNFNGTDIGFFAFENPCIGCNGPFIGYNANPGGFNTSQSINISSVNGESTIIEPTFTGNDVIAGPVTSPEPGTLSLMLMGVGLLGLMVIGRKRFAAEGPAQS
jgi:hypothetical protein